MQDGNKELKIKDSVTSLDDLKPENVEEKQNWDGVSWKWNETIVSMMLPAFNYQYGFSSNNTHFLSISSWVGETPVPVPPGYFIMYYITQKRTPIKEQLGVQTFTNFDSQGWTNQAYRLIKFDTPVTNTTLLALLEANATHYIP